jgi:hypothetical protein
MKQTLTIFTLFLSLLAFRTAEAQGSYSNYRDESYIYYYAPRKDTTMAALGVVFVKECNNYYVNGKSRSRERCTSLSYDTLGQKVKEARYKGEREVWSATYEYYEPGLLKSTVYRNNGTFVGSRHYRFDSVQRIIEIFSINKKGKVDYMNRYVYEGKNLTEKYFYTKDTVRYKYYTQNWYEGDSGAMLRAVRKDAKGKVLYVWDYGCNTHGEIKKAELKKESRICTSDTRLPNGHRLQQFDEITKEGALRYISETDSADRMVQWTKYSGKAGDKLAQQITYSYSDQGRETLTQVYDIKTGKLLAQYEYRYNNDNQILSSLSKRYNKKQKLTSSWETQNTYDGRLLSRTAGTSLLKPGRESITVYSYTRVQP